MNPVRLGIIGMGAIGRFHAKSVLEQHVPACELKAVCGPRLESLQDYQPLALFTDGMELIRSGLVDAVLIATPHPLHVPYALAALERGMHVLIEKPVAASKADAERLLDAFQAAKLRYPGAVCAGMLQMRTEPRYQKIKELIRIELGSLVRLNWINTDWFRTEAYYSSSAWRATWKGEGGGIVINQCLHNLDMLQWLCGMPVKVNGFCQLGRFHRIEVEDSVTAYFEWANGMTGTYISSSGEAPGTNRLEIVGTRGSLVLEKDQIRLTRLATEATQFSKDSPTGFALPEFTVTELPLENADLPHALILRNFIGAIRDGESPIAPIKECIHSVELANAILFSSLLGESLYLPLDGAAWEKKLQDLVAQSTLKKEVVPPSEQATVTFRR